MFKSEIDIVDVIISVILIVAVISFFVLSLHAFNQIGKAKDKMQCTSKNVNIQKDN